MMMANRYYVYLPWHDKPVPWSPAACDADSMPERTYFGRMLAAMERRLTTDELTFYLTSDLNKLPSYGEDVVAIVIWDEWCRIPRYARDVKAVFKCYGTQLMLGTNLLQGVNYLSFLTSVQFARTWIARSPSVLRDFVHGVVHSAAKPAHIYDIPLGYHKQLDTPMKPISERRYDVYFRGSIQEAPRTMWSLKYWSRTPKDIARSRLISNMEKLAKKYHQLNVAMEITPGFFATTADDVVSYSKAMSDTKICVVPRGTSYETYRFFEGLRSGCILISEALPNRWFYNSAPVIRVREWNELEDTVLRLVRDGDMMQQMHKRSLSWWNDVCSERAVGAYIADRLNVLSDQSTVRLPVERPSSRAVIEVRSRTS